MAVVISIGMGGSFGSGGKGSWGGPEGIHQQLLELRRELGKTDVQTVCSLMTLSRQQALLEIETSLIQLKIRHEFLSIQVTNTPSAYIRTQYGYA